MARGRPHVPQRLRHIQDRRRAVEQPHHGADAGGSAVPGRALRRPTHPGRWPARRGALPAARLARFHRQGARDRPRGDPGAGGVPAGHARPGRRRGGAGEGGRREGRPSGGAGAGLRPRPRYRLRLRPAAGPAHQRHGSGGGRRPRQPGAPADLLLDRRRLREDRGRDARERPRGRAGGGGNGALSLRLGRRDAGDGRPLGPLGRSDEACQRGGADAGARARRRAQTGCSP